MIAALVFAAALQTVGQAHIGTMVYGRIVQFSGRYGCSTSTLSANSVRPGDRIVITPAPPPPALALFNARVEKEGEITIEQCWVSKESPRPHRAWVRVYR